MNISKNQGFTLLELIVTLILVGILAVSAVSRFGEESAFAVKIEQENLISILNQAQQLAMSGQSVEFSVIAGSPQSVAIRLGSPLAYYSVGSIKYPQVAHRDVVISPSPVVITYSNLGRPNAPVSFTVSAAAGGSAGVCLENSGYAHAC